MSRVFIGIDVSKDYLDAAVLHADRQPTRFDNTAEGIAKLVDWVRDIAPYRIVFESTGHYQKKALGALLAVSLPAVVVNPQQVRDFAKGLGQRAKTDTIDAAVLARFGEVVETTVRPLPSSELAEFQALIDRRNQLIRMRATERQHLHAADSARVKTSIDRHVRYLDKQIDELEDRLDRFVDQTETFKAKDEILQSIKGFGSQVSRTIMAFLPELGQGTRQGISAMAGLAPYNNDSGQGSRPRRTGGGRAKVRAALYQAAVVAVRCSPVMKAFYAKLVAHGKAKKVAIVAVARKLLVLAHAMIRNMKKYEERTNSICPKIA